MFLCLRVDLDYVPWDTPDAQEFGHGEPAQLLRLLELGRHTGYKFHFFVSNRALRAFPATAEAVLNEGHDLDWFCKHPEQLAQRVPDARALFRTLGHAPRGLCVRDPWPADIAAASELAGLEFLSAPEGPVPAGLTLFPVVTRTDREASRAGLSARKWAGIVKDQIRECASRNVGLTVCVRPQVLAKFDPKLVYLKELLDLAQAVGLPVRTLREAVEASAGPGAP
jgi:hypothetical protein